MENGSQSFDIFVRTVDDGFKEITEELDVEQLKPKPYEIDRTVVQF
jgi:hypothetical protein